MNALFVLLLAVTSVQADNKACPANAGDCEAWEKYKTEAFGKVSEFRTGIAVAYCAAYPVDDKLCGECENIADGVARLRCIAHVAKREKPGGSSCKEFGCIMQHCGSKVPGWDCNVIGHAKGFGGHVITRCTSPGKWIEIDGSGADGNGNFIMVHEGCRGNQWVAALPVTRNDTQVALASPTATQVPTVETTALETMETYAVASVSAPLVEDDLEWGTESYVSAWEPAPALCPMPSPQTRLYSEPIYLIPLRADYFY